MRRTKEDAEQTRNNILEAAAKIFSDKGFARSTLDEIAKDAKVTRGAIYWHFKNKAEIYEALHDNLHLPFIDIILQDVSKDHPAPLTQLREFTINILLDLDHDEQKRQSLVLFLMRANYSGELAQFKEDHLKKKHESQEALARYFLKAQNKGELSADADPNFLAEAWGCYIRGILFEYLSDTENFILSEKIPNLVNLFFDMLEKR